MTERIAVFGRVVETLSAAKGTAKVRLAETGFGDAPGKVGRCW
jgi:hypothetical protein